MEAQSYYVNNTKDPLHPKQLHSEPKLASLQHQLHESSIPYSEDEKHNHIRTKERFKNKVKGVSETIHDQYYLWTSHHKSIPPITKPMVRKEGSDVGKIEMDPDAVNKLVTQDIPRTHHIQSTTENIEVKKDSQKDEMKSNSSTSSETLNKLKSHKRELPNHDQINQSLKSVEDEIENEKCQFDNKKENHKDQEPLDSDGNSGATHEEQGDKKQELEQQLQDNSEEMKRQS